MNLNEQRRWPLLTANFALLEQDVFRLVGVKDLQQITKLTDNPF